MEQQHALAVVHELAFLDEDAVDQPVIGRAQQPVVHIDPLLVELGQQPGRAVVQHGELRIGHFEAPPLGLRLGHLGACGLGLGIDLLQVGLDPVHLCAGLVEGLPGDHPALVKRLGAAEFGAREVEVREQHRASRPACADIALAAEHPGRGLRVHDAALDEQPPALGLQPGKLGFETLHPELRNAVIEMGQHLPGLHAVALLDREFENHAVHLARQRHHVRLDARIIFVDMGEAVPHLARAIGQRGQGDDCDREIAQPPHGAAAPRRRRGRGGGLRRFSHCSCPRSALPSGSVSH